MLLLVTWNFRQPRYLMATPGMIDVTLFTKSTFYLTIKAQFTGIEGSVPPNVDILTYLDNTVVPSQFDMAVWTAFPVTKGYVT